MKTRKKESTKRKMADPFTYSCFRDMKFFFLGSGDQTLLIISLLSPSAHLPC